MKQYEIFSPGGNSLYWKSAFWLRGIDLENVQRIERSNYNTIRVTYYGKQTKVYNYNPGQGWRFVF